LLENWLVELDVAIASLSRASKSDLEGKVLLQLIDTLFFGAPDVATLKVGLDLILKMEDLRHLPNKGLVLVKRLVDHAILQEL
jgi:hypothetical protein